MSNKRTNSMNPLFSVFTAIAAYPVGWAKRSVPIMRLLVLLPCLTFTVPLLAGDGKAASEQQPGFSFDCDNTQESSCRQLSAREEGKAVKIVGFDNISAVQALIRDGRIVCTIDQHADQIAVNGIKYALEVLKTGQTPQDKETPVDLITIESLQGSQ